MIFIGITISLLTAAYELFTQQRGIVLVFYGIVSPLLFLLPRFIYYVSWRIKQSMKLDRIKHIELFGTLIIALNIPNSLFLHAMGIQYDRVLHFLVGMIIVFMMATILSAFYERPEISKKQILTWSGVSVFFGLFIFEWWQFTMDSIFGTKLFFDVTQNIVVDFREDILFGTIGLALGLFYVYFRFAPFILKKHQE